MIIVISRFISYSIVFSGADANKFKEAFEAAQKMIAEGPNGSETSSDEESEEVSDEESDKETQEEKTEENETKEAQEVAEKLGDLKVADPPNQEA